MNSTPETIGVTIKFKEPIIFHLAMVGIAKESELRQRFLALKDEEKAEKEYQLNVDLLAELSVKHPSVLEKVEAGKTGGLVPYDFENSPSGAVKKLFAVRTVTNERTAEYAVRAYFTALTPDVSFQ